MKTTTIRAGATGGWAGASMTHAGYDPLSVNRCLNQGGLYTDSVRSERTMLVKARIPDQLRGPLEAFVAPTAKVLP